MKLKLLLFLFLLAKVVSGQQLFYKTYTADSIIIQGSPSILKCKNDDYLFLSRAKKNSKSQISITRVDSVGNSLWGKSYSTYKSEYTLSLNALNDTTFLIHGGFPIDSNLPGWLFGRSDFITIDNNGNVLSKRALVDSTYNNNMRIIKLIANGSNIYGIGYSTANPHYFVGTYPDTLDRGFIFKADTSGNVIWAKKYGESFTRFYDFALTPDSCFMAVGYKDIYDTLNSNRKVITFKMDTNGSVLWAKDWDVDGILEAIIYDGSGYVIGGSVAYSFASTKAIALKIDDNGNLLWANGYGVGATGAINKVAKLKNGKLLYGFNGLYYWIVDSDGLSPNQAFTVTGVSMGEGFGDFIPENNGGFTAIGNKNTKACMFKIDSNYTSCTFYYGPITTTAFNIPFDSTTLVSTPFPLYLMDDLIVQNNIQIIDSTLCLTATTIEEVENLELNIYPNPFTDQLNVEMLNIVGSLYSFQIIDLTGRVVLSSNGNSTVKTFNTTSLPTGIYFFKVAYENSIVVKKTIKL